MCFKYCLSKSIYIYIAHSSYVHNYQRKKYNKIAYLIEHTPFTNAQVVNGAKKLRYSKNVGSKFDIKVCYSNRTYLL